MIQNRIGSDGDPTNEREREFLQLAMRLYQADGQGTLAALTRYAVNEIKPPGAEAGQEGGPATAVTTLDNGFKPGAIPASVLLVEGQHGLGPQMTKAMPAQAPASNVIEAAVTPPWGLTDPNRTVPFQLRLPEDIHTELAWYGTTAIPGGMSMQKLLNRAARELLDRLRAEFPH